MAIPNSTDGMPSKMNSLTSKQVGRQQERGVNAKMSNRVRFVPGTSWHRSVWDG